MRSPPAEPRRLNFRTLWVGASFPPTIQRQARTDSVASAKAAPVASRSNKLRRFFVRPRPTDSE
jgi:hypothetical protein